MTGKALSTRLTEFFGIDHPVIQAPMAFAAGGKLAAAVSRAGGLGMIGGAYGNAQWVEAQFEAAGNQPVGCGFITWALAEKSSLLDQVLARQPKAIFLSFADPKPFAATIRDAKVPLICQVQTVRDAERAIDIGADVVVAQGAEAGGHGESRATFTLVPEIADMIAAKRPQVLLCAAGGVGDGRGLAAALMLGADGAVVGSRFWASTESLAHPNMVKAALTASGDDTIRSSVMDVARRLNWPQRYTARVLKNRFTEQWHHHLDDLIADQDRQAERWTKAWQVGDIENANTFVGEVTGILNTVEPAADILHTMVTDAAKLIGRG